MIFMRHGTGPLTRSIGRFGSGKPVEGRMQLTLAILKPHICKDPTSLQTIRSMIIQDGFLFIRSTEMRLTEPQAQLFYQEHQGKFFYRRLISLMTSGTSWIHILARTDAIQRWRQLMGPTKVYKTRIDNPETIRGIFGLTDTRNATHGSDSPKTSQREIQFFFPDFPIIDWFHRDEQEFLSKNVWLDEKEWIHRIKDS